MRTREESRLYKRTVAAQKIFKEVPEYLESTKYAHTREINGKNYQMFTNGYIGFMLNEPLPELQQSKQNNGLNMYEFIKDFGNRTLTDIDLSAVKEVITENKKIPLADRNKYPFVDIGNSRYNAKYLLQCYEILGGDIKFYQDEEKPLQGAILESENGKAMLMPIRKDVN